MGALLLALLASTGLAAPSGAETEHGLALLPGGQLMGWGANEFGQVRADQGAWVAQPLALPWPGAKPVAVASGARHSLVLDAAGQVWAWGDNSAGQLGLGHTRPAAQPTQVPGLPLAARAVAAGTQHSAALLEDGSVWVWGANHRGQLGNGTLDRFAVGPRATRVADLPAASALASGDDFLLALASSPAASKREHGKAQTQVWSWGAGQAVAQPMRELVAPSAIRAQGDSAMARSAGGHYWRWRGGQALAAPGTQQAFAALGNVAPAPLNATPPQTPLANAAKPLPAQAQRLEVKPVAVARAPMVATSPALPARPSVLKLPPPATVAALPPAPVAPAATVSSAPAAPTSTAALASPAAPPTAPATAAPAAPAAAARAAVRGTVRLAEAPLEGVQVAAEGASCSASDSQGHYLCQMAAGWSGRITLRRANYRFAPSAMTFKNLHGDADQQDFSAIYDPR